MCSVRVNMQEPNPERKGRIRLGNLSPPCTPFGQEPTVTNLGQPFSVFPLFLLVFACHVMDKLFLK
jgi:hypothetical protein